MISCLALTECHAGPHEVPADLQARKASTSSLLKGAGVFLRPQFHLWQWEPDPRVLLLEFPDRSSQAAAMNRLAAFVEKRGVRGRLLNDRQLADYIRRQGIAPEDFYLAHDYRFRDLARFFTAAGAGTDPGPAVQNRDSSGHIPVNSKAATPRVALNPFEWALFRLLSGRGLFSKQLKGGQSQKLTASRPGVLLTLPANTTASTRRWVLTHELRHALYFLNDRYRGAVNQVWHRRLDRTDRQAIRRALTLADYDPSDETLMRNEFQAYVLAESRPYEQTLRRLADRDPSGIIARYLKQRPGRVQLLRGWLNAELGPLRLQPE